MVFAFFRLRPVFFDSLKPNLVKPQFGAPEQIPSLLLSQLSSTVQWQRSLLYCHNRGVTNWIVVGPTKALANLLRRGGLGHVRCVSTREEAESWGKELSQGRSNPKPVEKGRKTG